MSDMFFDNNAALMELDNIAGKPVDKKSRKQNKKQV